MTVDHESDIVSDYQLISRGIPDSLQFHVEPCLDFNEVAKDLCRFV